jgi:hypothetical protein
MQVNACTDEFQDVWKRYRKTSVEPEDVRKLVKKRRMVEVYKNEIDHIIDDYAKSIDEPHTPLHQKMKMEELYKHHNAMKKNLQNMHKKEPEFSDIYNNLNKKVSRINIFKARMSSDKEEVSIGPDLRSIHCTPQQKKSLPSIFLTKTPRIDTESTRLQTEPTVVSKHKGVLGWVVQTEQNRKKDIKKFIRDIDTYEKVLEKSRDASQRKIEEFERRKDYFRRRYKNAYDINLALVL